VQMRGECRTPTRRRQQILGRPRSPCDADETPEPSERSNSSSESDPEDVPPLAFDAESVQKGAAGPPPTPNYQPDVSTNEIMLPIGQFIVPSTKTGPRCFSFRCKITVSLAQGAVHEAEADVADPVFVRSTIRITLSIWRCTHTLFTTT